MAKGSGEGVDKIGLEEGFVALDIDDMGGGFALTGSFGDAVGAGRVVAAGANGAGSNGFAKAGDAVVIGGDDEFIDFPAEGGPLKNVLEKGLPQERMEGLSGEAGRSPAGRDDANDSCFFVVNYNPPSAVSRR